jgi:hypothetical protein
MHLRNLRIYYCVRRPTTVVLSKTTRMVGQCLPSNTTLLSVSSYVISQINIIIGRISKLQFANVDNPSIYKNHLNYI